MIVGAIQLPLGYFGRLASLARRGGWWRLLLLGAGNQRPRCAALLLGADDGAEVGALLEAAVNVELLGALGEFSWEPLLRCSPTMTRVDEGRAALAGGAKGGPDDAVDEMVLVAVRKDGSMVLGA